MLPLHQTRRYSVDTVDYSRCMGESQVLLTGGTMGDRVGRPSNFALLASAAAASLGPAHNSIDSHSEQQHGSVDHFRSSLGPIQQAANHEFSQDNRPERAAPTQETDPADHSRPNCLQ